MRPFQARPVSLLILIILLSLSPKASSSTTSTSETTPTASGSTQDTESTGSTPDTTVDGTGTTPDTTSVGAGSTQDTTPDGTGSTQDTTPDGTGSTQDTTSDGTGSTQDTTPDGTGSTQDTTSDGTGSTQDTTSDGTGSTQDTTSDGTGSTQDTTTDGTGRTQDTTSDGTGSTQDATSDGIGSTQETTTDGTGSTQDTTFDGTGSTPDTTPDGTGSTLDTTTDGTGSTQDTTSDGIGSTQDTTTDGTGSTQDTTFDGTGSTPDTTPDGTGSTPGTTLGGTGNTPDSGTTITQTITTKKYKYDTSPPSLDGAVYILNFEVLISGDGNIATKIAPLIARKFNESFLARVEEFKEIKIMTVGINTRRVKRETTPVNLQAYFNAKSMNEIANTTAFRQRINDVVDDVRVHPVGVSFTIQDYGDQLEEILAKSRDVCAATGDICPDVSQVCSSQDQLCIHRCEYKTCGVNGYCTVVHGNEDGNTQEPEAKCQCSQDDGLYERSGDICDTETMKWQYVLAICCGVAGIIILVLVVVIVCVYCQRKTAKYKEQLDQDDDYIYLQDFYRTRTIQPVDDITDFTRSNEGYQPDNPYIYQGSPSGLSWLHEAQAGTQMKDRALQSFQPHARPVDHQSDFHIKRPQISSRPKSDEQLR